MASNLYAKATVSRDGGGVGGVRQAGSRDLCEDCGMSWTLGLEYIKALIWPAFALILIFVFKGQVRKLLERMSSIDTPLGKASFAEKAGELAREAEGLNQAEAAILAVVEQANVADQPSGDKPPPEVGLGDGELVPLPSVEQDGTPQPGTGPSSVPTMPDTDMAGDRHDVVAAYGQLRMADAERDNLLETAAVSPAAAVAMAWTAVERRLVATMPAPRKLPATAYLRDAERTGLLDASAFGLAQELRMLRNQVVHGEEVRLTTDGAVSYVEAARNVVDALALGWLEQKLGLRRGST